MMQIILFIMINRVIRQYGSTQFPYWLPGDLDLLKLSALSAISGALPFRSAWAQTDAIQFGCPVPMSGAFAANGKYADIGMKLALEQRGTLLNRPLAYTVLDTEGKPATAVRKVQEAVQQKGARYFAGGILSSEALAMGKELERLNGIFITTAGADEITGKDCNKATFRWSVPTYGAINQTVRPLIERHPNAKRWYTISGPTYTGQRACMGRSAVLDIGQARLVITERTHEPWDLGVFESLGQDPRQARYLLLKSRMYCRPVFVPISDGLIECDSPGATSADWSMFPYRKRNRPLYPLEDVGPDLGLYAR